jgi:hypothetical protein
MSVDFLEEMETKIEKGQVLFACPTAISGEWILSKVLEDLRPKAQRAANTKKHELNIYRLVNKSDAVTGDSFLVVRKFLEPQHDGTPKMQWSLVDTKEASEMMRDVSQGPSPYFGAVVEETFKPA